MGRISSIVVGVAKFGLTCLICSVRSKSEPVPAVHRKKSLRNGLRVLARFVPLTLVFIKTPAFAQESAPLPTGVKAEWDCRKAYHETTPTRERICLNGLWRWRPA